MACLVTEAPQGHAASHSLNWPRGQPAETSQASHSAQHAVTTAADDDVSMKLKHKIRGIVELEVFDLNWFGNNYLWERTGTKLN